jgi:uncharacterized membrane protein
MHRMLYLTLKWIHILLAITALGANITYTFWIIRATRNRDALPFTLRGIKILDDRIANPAYGFLLITGIAMVLVSGLTFETPWIAVSMVLFIIIVLVAAIGYTPTLRKQIALAESVGPDSPEYQSIARRGQILGIVLGILVVTITFFMVTKPGLWS